VIGLGDLGRVERASLSDARGGSHSLAGPKLERNIIYFFVKTIVTLGWALVLGSKRLFVL
jgi:hypothetical protein